MYQEFTVKGMSCNHCKGRVEDALKAVDGVFNVVVNLGSGRVTVECRDEVELDVLITAVEDAGYTFQEEE
jgi:copper chaperone CopZ